MKLKEEIPSVETVAVNLADWKATQKAVRSVFPIDLLVNNAGQGEILPLTEVTEENYNKYIHKTHFCSFIAYVWFLEYST